MSEPARTDHQRSEPEPEKESVDWSTYEVIQKNEFLYPAGGGVAIVVILLLTDSPFAWVATFSYFLLGLPGLIFYLKGRARPPIDQSWRYAPVETGNDLATIEKLKKFQESTRFSHSEEVERALSQYDQALVMYKMILLRVRSVDSPARHQAQQIFIGIMGRLKSCVHHFSQLMTIDSSYVMRRVQALNSKSQMNEYDQVELQSMQSKITSREQILHDLIDALRANDRALAELAHLAQTPPGKASSVS
jgi:hypothetical protein